jgi:tRNA G18 (ribose-2'-O)-methylase SpoU
MQTKGNKEIVLLLHNIRSVINVGAIMRTADACAVSKIIFSGYTPTPVDRFGRLRKDFIKASLGAEKTVPWEYIKTAGRVIDKYKKLNFEIVALEQDQKSIDYKKVKIKKNELIILGNEPKGISKSLLDKVDTIAEIPMKGKKESLNVSVATGIFLFRVLNI